LREKKKSDIPDDYKWRSDPELAELDSTRPLSISYKDFERLSKDEMSYPSSRSKRLSVDTLDGQHIGNVMFYDIDLRSGQAELGIMIGEKDYWSRGYGTETVGLLLDHMFEEYPFNRVYLHTLVWNHRAQKSFHRAGFRDIAPVRKSGRDFIKMEIWRHEWEAMRTLDRNDSKSPLSLDGRGLG
jgi:RimJ/RimL family protein N-acetyltransferase